MSLDVIRGLTGSKVQTTVLRLSTIFFLLRQLIIGSYNKRKKRNKNAIFSPKQDHSATETFFQPGLVVHSTSLVES
jgi:hypothetical protein